MFQDSGPMSVERICGMTSVSMETKFAKSSNSSTTQKPQALRHLWGGAHGCAKFARQGPQSSTDPNS